MLRIEKDVARELQIGIVQHCGGALCLCVRKVQLFTAAVDGIEHMRGIGRKRVQRLIFRLRSQHAAVFGEQGRTKIAVIEQHERLVLRVEVRNCVRNAHAFGVQRSPNAAGESQMRAVKTRFMDFARGFQNVIVLFPARGIAELLGGDCGNAAVGRVNRAGFAMTADIVQPAGRKHSAGPLLREFALQCGIAHRRAHSVAAEEGDIHALIRKIVNVHAAIGGHGKAQPGGVMEFGDRYALPCAVRELCKANAGELIDVPDFAERFDSRIDDRVVLEHQRKALELVIDEFRPDCGIDIGIHAHRRGFVPFDHGKLRGMIAQRHVHVLAAHFQHGMIIIVAHGGVEMITANEFGFDRVPADAAVHSAADGFSVHGGIKEDAECAGRMAGRFEEGKRRISEGERVAIGDGIGDFEVDRRHVLEIIAEA